MDLDGMGTIEGCSYPEACYKLDSMLELHASPLLFIVYFIADWRSVGLKRRRECIERRSCLAQYP